MWVRKSPESMAAEMAERTRPPRLLPVLAISAAATAVVGILFSLGIRSFWRGTIYLDSSESSREALSRRPWMLIIVFAVIFWVVYRGRKSPGSLFGPAKPALLCTRCFEPHSPHASQCPCGGELEPITQWEWVDDEEEQLGGAS